MPSRTTWQRLHSSRSYFTQHPPILSMQCCLPPQALPQHPVPLTQHEPAYAFNPASRQKSLLSSLWPTTQHGGHHSEGSCAASSCTCMCDALPPVEPLSPLPPATAEDV